MFGLLSVHKPSGPTSRRVVDRVQRLVRPAKVGHAGTLDPLASGVLVLGIGPATRLMAYVQQHAKSYRATFLLGRISPTEDIEGHVTTLVDAPVPERSELVAAAERLRGEILQRPPAYSALKVAGQRAYALARQGELVELAPRPITVYRLDVLDYAYPQVELEIECSSGTYVRSLGRDLAESLGTGAVMSALVRTAIGPFTLETSLPAEAVSAESIRAGLHDPLLAVAHLPRLEMTDAERTEVVHGRTIADPWQGGHTEIAAVDIGGQLVALLGPIDEHRLRPTRCFGP